MSGICQFGLAHVDSPKGDLDASSGALSNASEIVVVNDFIYRFGTTELYPATTDIAGNVLTNTAHEYRECSNKGLCDRSTGTCSCFEGYEGSACQRASCPSGPNGVCSGHGTCETISEIAAQDFDNIYRLWDEDITMGCVCDSGYSGADCSQRVCPIGIDPLYLHKLNIRYANVSISIYTRSSTAVISGYFALRWYDILGQSHLTQPIAFNASCREVVKAFEVQGSGAFLPADSMRCLRWTSIRNLTFGDDPIHDPDRYGIKYTLTFPRSPGYLRQPQVERFLDGRRATLTSSEGGASGRVITKVYGDGFWGESFDYFPMLCEGVGVRISRYLNASEGVEYYYLDGLTPIEKRLLARCLGDADGDSSTYSAEDVVAGERFVWDYGSIYHPHILLLTPEIDDIDGEALTDLCPGEQDSIRGAGTFCRPPYPFPYLHSDPGTSPSVGLVAALAYDPISARFVLFTRAGRDFGSDTTFSIRVSLSAVAQLVSDRVCALTRHDQLYSPFLSTQTCGLANATNPLASIFPSLLTDINIAPATLSTLSAYTSSVLGVVDEEEMPTPDLSCEYLERSGPSPGLFHCLDKGDRVIPIDMSLSWEDNGDASRSHAITLFTIVRIGSGGHFLNETNNLITMDMAVPNIWTTLRPARLYRLSPALPSVNYAPEVLRVGRTPLEYPSLVNLRPGKNVYPVTTECANRGYCDRTAGLCNCFPGFVGQACELQDNSKSV